MMTTRRVGTAALLALLALFGGAGGPPGVTADDGTATAPRDPLAVVTAYATAFAAGDAAALAATLSDGVALGDRFCCPIHPAKAQFVDTLPRSWASGLRPHFVVGPAAGDTVTLRMLNNYDWDWQRGIAPLEIVYTLVVRDGLVAQGDGTVDPASEHAARPAWPAHCASHPAPGWVHQHC